MTTMEPPISFPPSFSKEALSSTPIIKASQKFLDTAWRHSEKDREGERFVIKRLIYVTLIICTIDIPLSLKCKGMKWITYSEAME